HGGGRLRHFDSGCSRRPALETYCESTPNASEIVNVTKCYTDASRSSCDPAFQSIHPERGCWTPSFRSDPVGGVLHARDCFGGRGTPRRLSHRLQRNLEDHCRGGGDLSRTLFL